MIFWSSWWSTDIAPLFEKKYPDVLFIIGGSECPKFNRKNIKSLGFINDLHGVISTADIAIVPLDNGAGTKLKISDYFCAGVPVITTKKGIEGIDAKNGENVVIVENVDPNFINSIKYLIENKSERKRIGLNGFQLARKKYDWVKIGDDLGKLYLKILKKSCTRLQLQLIDIYSISTGWNNFRRQVFYWNSRKLLSYRQLIFYLNPQEPLPQ